MASDNGDMIAQAIHNGNAVAVSNGSSEEGFVTASWVVEGRNSKGRVEGRCVLPGIPSNMDAC